jgi:hypothetical protein
MSVLRVSREEQGVRVRLDFWADGASWYAALGCTPCGDGHAALLAEKLRHTIAARAEEIRREAYNEGCQDRRLGRPKQKVFSGDF